jgi:16S rRNA (guanine527-N7)-methyltransferase
MANMDALFRSCGIGLSAEQLRRFWDYHSLLRQRNPDLNLTRVHHFNHMVLKLYVDSVLPAQMLDLPSPLLDLGTGPGMPGIPLKILRPQLEVILAESRGKRVDFLQEAIARLGLPGLSVAAGRVTERFETPVAGVITRAVEPVGATLERVQGCLAADGRVILMKGPHCDPEIEQARTRFEKRYALDLDRSYTIPTTRHQRRLLIYRRLDEPLYSRRAKAMSARTVRSITSGQNPLFKDLKKLLTGRGVRKRGQALVSGSKLMADLVAHHPERCAAWLSREDLAPPPPHAPEGLQWIQLAPALHEELDVFGTHAPLMLISLPEIPAWSPADGFNDGCSLLIPFQDPENVGAAIRSAAAFGVSRVILLAESAHPFHPKALRASGGAVLSVRLRQGPALGELPAHLPILALSADGADLRWAEFPPAFGLLAGMEGPGLPEPWRGRALRIPIRPEVESLNAAAAVSVALYEWRRRQGEVRKAEGGDIK